MKAHAHQLRKAKGVISCGGCPLSVRQPAGMPDYRRAGMASWTAGRLKITS